MENQLKQSKYKTIVKFENGMEIKANQMSWVLYVPSQRIMKGGVYLAVINLNINKVNGIQVNSSKGFIDFILDLVQFISKLI